MKRVLSTKRLSPAQKELILNSGVSLVEYDAIKIELLNFELPQTIDKAIFTSQNAVRSLLQKDSTAYKIGQCFCVGEKTAALLSENGQKVVKIAENGAKLSDFIQKTFKNEPFYFFTGNLRGEDIPEIENKSENSIFELKTYKTTLNLMKFDQIFDKIMFFSPSGVISFSAENNFADAVAVCIGTTTASEAKKHTDKIEVANTTTVESVIAKTVKTIFQND